MKQIFLFVKDRFLGRHLDFRVRLFNVLAMVGTSISILMAVSALFTQESIEVIKLLLERSLLQIDTALSGTGLFKDF